MRETALLESLRTLVRTSELYDTWVHLECVNLDIGDVHVISPATTTYEPIVIERKTIADVASSIQDGRWSEQKHRALAHYAPHQLIYLIEVDDMKTLFESQPMYGRIDHSTVMHAIFNLGIHYKIRYLFLEGTPQVAQYVYRMAYQLHRLRTSKKSRTGVEEGVDVPLTKYERSLVQAHYSGISSKKRLNMTPHQFFVMFLQIVPGISQKTADNIHGMFDGSFMSMIDFIRDHDKATFTALYRKTYNRSVNRNVVEGLYHLLLDTDNHLHSHEDATPSSVQNGQEADHRPSSSMTRAKRSSSASSLHHPRQSLLLGTTPTTFLPK